MGCFQTKFENEDAMRRCKHRMQFMKDSVAARNAFAASHSAYSLSLKNTAATLRDYCAFPQSSVVRIGEEEYDDKESHDENLTQVFLDLDDHSLKAWESAHEVSKMLEATALHYHSNFADHIGHFDHSARVMRAITWNPSFRGIANVDDVKDDFDPEELETHATVLNRMLDCEKKLYDEVKANETTKVMYRKKVASMKQLKTRNPNSKSLAKREAAVSYLHTRYVVGMQSVDITVSEINRLRDKLLYPRLVQLIDGMATMWETMRVQHETQSKIADALRYLDISQCPSETSEHQHERTFELWTMVQEWHLQFCRLIDNQRAYVKSLNNWLTLNLIPTESSNPKEKVSCPPRIQSPSIEALLIAWQDDLEKLRDEAARSAINNFAAAVNTILQLQEEEMMLKEKCEQRQKELTRRTKQVEDLYNKYTQQRTPEELDLENEDSPHKEVIAKRQLIVDMLKKRLQEEEEAHQKQCLQVREKSLASLTTCIPELFSAMSDISFTCSEMYKNLRSIASSNSS